jgi:ligand-binding sensor domain-containing protein
LGTDRWANFTRAQGLCDNRINAIAEDKNVLWIATQGGVSRYDTRAGTWQTFTTDDGLPHNIVWAVAVDDDKVWIGTNNGAARYRASEGKWRIYTTVDGLINNVVNSISVEDKYIFLTTPAGVTIYDKEVGSLSPYSRKDGLIASEAKSIGSKEKYHWIGTVDGITLYNQITDLSRDFTVTEGLPSNNIQVVAVDGDEIWFGTDAGLARHHWRSGIWTVYSEAPTEVASTSLDLMSNNVKSVISDSDNLWVGTRVGLARYDKILHTWHVANLGYDPLRSTENAQTVDLKRAVDNTVEAVEEGITDLSRDFTVTEGLPSNNIQVVAVDGDEIWFGTDAGLARHHWRSGIWTVYSEAPTEVASTSLDLMSNNVKSVISDSDNLWVGTRVGLARYDKILHTWHVANLGYDPLRSTENAQTVDLKRAVDNTVEAVEEALQATSPSTEQKVYVEYDPVVAQEKAVQALHQVIIQKTPMPNDPIIPSPFLDLDITFPPSPVVRVIEPIFGTLWIGTEAGVIIYNKAREQVIKTHPLLPWVREIKYHQGRTWVLCDDMIAIRDLKADSWVLISGRQVVEQTRARTSVGYTEKIETASEDWGIVDCTAMTFMGDQIWIGRENGLKILKVDFPQFEFASEINIPEYLQEAEITALDFDGRDTWIGTRNGLFQYHSETGAWRPYTILNGLAGNEISAITAGDKSIWVGTAGEGLSRYDKSAQEWGSFRLEDGLADNNIRSIALDGKYIWIGTFSAGVCRYDLTTELWTTYQTADRLARR